MHRLEPTQIRPKIVASGVRGGATCEPVDVSWIELDAETAIGLGKKFIHLSQIQSGINHIGDDLVVMNGYPGAFTREYTDKVVSAQSLSFFGGTIAPSEWSKSAIAWPHCLTSKHHLVAAYPENGNQSLDGQPIQLPEPDGMSGGGLWWMPLNAERKWRSNQLRLIGINTEWNSDERWLSANQTQYWLELVAEDFPDICERITRYLND